MTNKTAIKNAIEAIVSGDARNLRKSIKEALVNKVRKALNKKEKQIAKNLIESATITEALSSADKKAVLSSLEKIKNAEVAGNKRANLGHGLLDIIDRNPSLSSGSTVSTKTTNGVLKRVFDLAFDDSVKTGDKNLAKVVDDAVALISKM